MPARLHRSQILLEDAQYEALVRLARERHHSISEVTRELVRRGLEALRVEKTRRAATLARLTRLRSLLEKQKGIYPGDPVAAAREDRARSLALRVFPLPGAG